jgi:hypothetical protein
MIVKSCILLRIDVLETLNDESLRCHQKRINERHPPDVTVVRCLKEHLRVGSP